MFSDERPHEKGRITEHSSDALDFTVEQAVRRRTRKLCIVIAVLAAISVSLVLVNTSGAQESRRAQGPPAQSNTKKEKLRNFDAQILANTNQFIDDGRSTFRFDTFGDEAFWGGALQLQQAIKGAALGGVGPGISPSTALTLGLKVDVDALPRPLINQFKRGQVNLDDPATTIALLKLNAVVGLQGFFDGNNLNSVGITCAVCHSTVDNSFAFGIGHRLDGWANRDLDVGKIVASAPNLGPFTNLLGVSDATVRAVLNSWGPGKFDAELFLDGKAFNPQQVTDGVVTGTNVPGATLIPNAFGLAGFNQHTWTGAWGTVTYWNAFVATLEMHGVGRFFDPRLNNAAKFPIAAANGFADLPHIPPGQDRITKKLPALHFYQLAIPAPAPEPGIDFNVQAAARGDELFSGKAGCNNCHVEPLWTEPGWNLHTPAEIGIDSFEADRAPDGVYKTMNLAGIFVRENGLFMNPANKGRYYHDGRFATLLDVINHYNMRFSLGLSAQEKTDLVEYLKSLPELE
jgi:cytochrome c peroxidase